MKATSTRRKTFQIVAILILIAAFVTAGYFWYDATDPKRQEAVKMGKMFNQPQWSTIDFKKGVTIWSMRPLLDDSKQQLELARNASKQAGVANPILPYFDPDPDNPNAKYFYAKYKRNLSESLGYELRFIAFADENTLSLYSIWVSAIPQTIDDNNNYVNVPEQKEFIYSIDATPEGIENDMKQYFISKGL
ncbi:MAG: hypothetical protein Q8903_15315, partial [Bacteroidota bacterium]|nr:hypothetical protein [Bacteroidota bacterium]